MPLGLGLVFGTRKSQMCRPTMSSAPKPKHFTLGLIGAQDDPVAVDFVTSRGRVFEPVLEVELAVAELLLQQLAVRQFQRLGHLQGGRARGFNVVPIHAQNVILRYSLKVGLGIRELYR
jgi:hypothetical protein